MDFSEIKGHPDSEEIISKLVSGTQPKDVSQWLKLKYPDSKKQSHLRLSIKILKDFVDSGYVDCYDQFVQDLTIVKESKNLQKTDYPTSLLNSKTYRERLLAIADQELDVKKMLQSLITVCYERAEQVFDKIQQDPSKIKGDHTFLKYMNEIFNMVEKFEKIVNNAPDQIIQHNVTLQAVENNTNAILEAIRETIAELDPETSMRFINSFYEKLRVLSPPESKIIAPEQRLQEATILHEKIVEKFEQEE